MSKPALTLEPNFRSGLERKVAEQLDAAGVEYTHESKWVPYVVPERTAKYLPDMVIEGTNILIECKGRFGGSGPGLRFSGDSAKERQKLLLIKEQHPEIDLRIVFQRASTPIYPKSPTTQAKWCDDHGIPWADKGTVPKEWLEEIRAQQRCASSKKSRKTK